MNRLARGMATVAILLLAGCGTAVDRQEERVVAHPALESVSDCEHALYYAPDVDQTTALHCANILDIWR